MLTGSGSELSYKTNTNNWTGHLGLGYEYYFDSKNMFTTSFKYIGTYLNCKQIEIDGENVKLDTINSSRLQFKEEWKCKYTPTLSVLGALGYEHEFDSRAKINTIDYTLGDQPSLKGGTGIAEIGVSYNPSNAVNQQFVDFHIQGATGKRKRTSAQISLKYTF